MKILILFTIIAVINAQNGTNTTKNDTLPTNSTGTTTPIQTTTSSLLRGTTTSFHITTISATTTNPVTTTTQQSATTDIPVTTTSIQPVKKTTIMSTTTTVTPTTTIIETTTMVPTTTIVETTTLFQTTTIAPYCNNETMNTSCIKCIGYLCKFVEKGNQNVAIELLFIMAFIAFIGLTCLMVYYYCIKPVIYHNVPADIYWTSDDEDDEASLLTQGDSIRKSTPPHTLEMTRTL